MIRHAAFSAESLVNKPSAPAMQEGQPTDAAAYETDFHAWALEQADLLRGGRVREADVLNIAEELADLGRSEYRALRSHLMRVMQHILEWQHRPDRRSMSWANSIRKHRFQVARALRENPSLKARLGAAMQEAYEEAVVKASVETGLPETGFPDACPYTYDVIMGEDFVLDPTGKAGDS